MTVTNNIFDSIFDSMNSINASHKAMIEEGIRIGRREAMTDCASMIRELCALLDSLTADTCVDRGEAEKLIGRAGALLKSKGTLP